MASRAAAPAIQPRSQAVPRHRSASLAPDFLAIFAFSAAVFLGVGYFEVSTSRLYLPETLARTAEATQIVHARTPGLAHLATSLAPLATFLQIIVAGSHAGPASAVAMSAASTTLVALALLGSLRAVHVSRTASLLIAALFCVSPWTLELATSGSSESIAAVILVWTVACIVFWATSHQDYWLGLAGLIFSFHVFASNSSIVLIGALAALILIISHQARAQPVQNQAFLVTFFLPTVFTFPVRLLLTAYFAEANPLLPPAPDASLVSQVVVPAILPLAACVCAFLTPEGRRASMVTGLALVTILTVLLQLLATLTGWVDAAVGPAVLQVLGIMLLAATPLPRARTALLALASAFTLLTPFVTAPAALSDPVAAALREDGAQLWLTEKAAAMAVTGLPSSKPTLLDDGLGYPIVAFSGNPSRFITPGDAGFSAALRDPQNEVGAILVSSVSSSLQDNSVASFYPQLYQNGAAWATLAVTMPGPSATSTAWKLFVIDNET